MKHEMSKHATLGARFLLCSLSMLVAHGTASAQLGTATISGNVTDPTGAVVVGANVTAVSNTPGFLRQTVSSEQGQYSLPGLTPGSYSLSVEFKGFRRAELTNITLQVDQNARIDVALEVGQTTETVEISAQAPLIE